MSNKHRSNRIYGQFSPRHVEMLESPSYRVLSLSAHRLLSRIEIEHANHGGKENGRLPVTYEQFCEYGIHRHAIGAAIREAVALGFVDVTQKGRAGNAEHRSSNLFRLTYRASKGAPGDGTHEWRKIADLDQAEHIARAARKNISQCRKTPNPSAGNRHRKPKSPVPESITTGHGSESITTSISRGGGEASTTPPQAGQPPAKPTYPNPFTDLAPGERPVFSENDFLSEDGAVFICHEELEALAQAYPSILNVAALAADACKTWLADIAPRDRKRAFLEWLAKRGHHGGFEPCRRQRNGHPRAAQ